MPKITRTPTCESRDHVEREALLHCSLRFEGKAPPPYVRGREPVPPQSPSSDPRENQPQQGWIIACTALCLPADVLVIFQAPFGDIVLVVVFYWTTVVFGIPMMLWLLRASEREEQRCDQSGMKRSLATALAAYRPEHLGGEISMRVIPAALTFAHNFVDFTCSMCAIVHVFVSSKEDEYPLWVFVAVVVGTTGAVIDLGFCTIFPGFTVPDYTVLIALQLCFDATEIAYSNVIMSNPSLEDEVRKWETTLRVSLSLPVSAQPSCCNNLNFSCVAHTGSLRLSKSMHCRDSQFLRPD